MNLQQIQNLSKDLKIDKNVIFVGKVPWDETEYYYNISDIFVTASTTETQGLTIIEAMAASTPPVCINDEAFVDTITNNLNGYIFNNEDEYCDIILKLTKDKDMRLKTGKQARIQSEHLSSKQFASNVLLVYEHAIANSKNYRYGLISQIVEKIRGE